MVSGTSLVDGHAFLFSQYLDPSAPPRGDYPFPSTSSPVQLNHLPKATPISAPLIIPYQPSSQPRQDSDPHPYPVVPSSASSETPLPTPPTSGPTSPPIALRPMVPQSTGGAYNTLSKLVRASVLGGREVNRFSTFVQSGAESFILEGNKSPAGPSETAASNKHRHRKDATDNSATSSCLEEGEAGEADRHFVEVSQKFPTLFATPPR